MIFFKRSLAISIAIICFQKKTFMKVLLIFVCIGFSSVYAQDLVSQSKAERLFATGTELMEKHQFVAARQNFTDYLGTHPQHELKKIEAEYNLALCALNLFHGDAEKRFAIFIETHSQHPRASTANFDLANFFYQEKNYKKATGYYAKIEYASLSAEQQNTAHFRAGYSQFSQKFLKDALDQFNFIKSQGGQYGPAASYYAGFIEYSQGDYENAFVDLKRAEQSAAYTSVVPYLIANVYYKKKEYEQLLVYTASLKSVQDITNADEIALLSAEAYFKKGDYKSAVAAYSSYLDGREDKADKGVLLRAGYSAYLINQDQAAINYLKLSFTDRDSIGFYSAYYLGSLYLKTNQKPMALTSFGIAKMFKPDRKLVEEASFQFAKVSYDLGRPDQAIAEFEGLLNSFPQSVHVQEVKELLSQAYVNANNFNKAIEYIESSPKRSGGVDRAYQKATLLKGIDYFNKDSYELAIQLFDKSTSTPIDRDYVAEADFWCGESYSILKKYEQAATHYHKVIEMAQPLSGLIEKSRYGLGYCYYNTQQYDRALLNFKEFSSKAKQGSANVGDGVLRLADCHYISKSYLEALAAYKKSIQWNTPDKDYAHLQAGVILGILRRYTEAAIELDVVIKSYPTSSIVDEAIFQRAQLEFEQGNYSIAQSGYTKLIVEHPSSRFAPYAFTRRAASNFNLKDYAKTSDDYITVLTQYPSHPSAKDVLLPLQESLNLAGRSTEFDKYLEGYKSANPDAKGIEAVEYESAKNQYFNQDYKKAIDNLSIYLKRYPTSSHTVEANYYLAESHYRLRDLPTALNIYYAISGDKSFAFITKVIGRIAEIEFKQSKYDKAISQYKLLMNTASTKKDQYAAWNGLMESHYLIGQYDSSKLYAETILERGNINAGAGSKATLFLGKNAQAIGDFDTAKDEYLSTINSAQDEFGAEAKFHLGELFYQLKDHKQCYETLVSLNTDFASYSNWVGKSYLLLSENFLALGDPFNAKAVLKSLIENFPLEDVKMLAKAKLAAIDQLETKQKVKADSTENEN
jgi:TolA-binding protein